MSLGSCLNLNTVDINQGTGAKELAELCKQNVAARSVALVGHAQGIVSVTARAVEKGSDDVTVRARWD